MSQLPSHLPCTDFRSADCLRKIWFQAVFHYQPNENAAYAVMVIFFVLSLISLVLTIRSPRKVPFMFIIFGTGLVEAVGYALRILTIEKQQKGPHIGSLVLLILPPVPLAVINYTVVGKLLKATGRNMGFLKPQHVAWFFLGSDIATLFIQGAGGGMAGSDSTTARDFGLKVVLAGLALQFAFFAFFSFITVFINVRPEYRLKGVSELRKTFWTLYATIIFMFIRNLYRVVEFVEMLYHPDSDVNSYEWVFYVFDAVPILLCFVIYSIPNFGHFGYVLPGEQELDGLVQARAKSMELVSVKSIDDRQTPNENSVKKDDVVVEEEVSEEEHHVAREQAPSPHEVNATSENVNV